MFSFFEGITLDDHNERHNAYCSVAGNYRNHYITEDNFNKSTSKPEPEIEVELEKSGIQYFGDEKTKEANNGPEIKIKSEQKHQDYIAEGNSKLDQSTDGPIGKEV